MTKKIAGIPVLTMLLGGCGIFLISLQTNSCNSPELDHCPGSVFTDSGGQCTYTYYKNGEFNQCVEDKSTVPVSCIGDTSSPSAVKGHLSARDVGTVPYAVNQMLTYIAAPSGPAPFDLKKQLLDLPFGPVSSGSGSSVAGEIDCDNNVTVLSVGYTRGTVLPIVPCSLQVGSGISTGAGSLQLAITPDAQFAWVTNLNGQISLIDLTRRSVAGTIQTPGASPFGIAFSPDGATAYVTSYDAANPSLLVLDTTKRTVTSTVKLTDVPTNVFTSPDGSLLWISQQAANTVLVLDALTLTKTAAIPIPSPTGIAFNATGTAAYVSSGTTPGTVKAVSTLDYSITQSYNVGNVPVDIRIGKSAFAQVLNRNSDFISEINLITGQVTSDPQALVPNAVHTGLAFVQ